MQDAASPELEFGAAGSTVTNVSSTVIVVVLTERASAAV
jgi:hypothetical protein